MPKVLTDVTENPSWETGVTAMRQRPALAPMVAEVINIGAQIEQQWSYVLAKMAHADPVASLVMLRAIKSTGAQREAIKDIAKLSLSDEHLRIFKAVATASQSQASTRNSFCHGVWAICPTLPDHLLLMDPTVPVDIAVGISSQMLRLPGRSMPPIMSAPFSKIEAYSHTDLADATDHASMTLAAIQMFHFLLWSVFSERGRNEDWASDIEAFQSALYAMPILKPWLSRKA